jgi:hypothetical protein
MATKATSRRKFFFLNGGYAPSFSIKMMHSINPIPSHERYKSQAPISFMKEKDISGPYSRTSHQHTSTNRRLNQVNNSEPGAKTSSADPQHAQPRRCQLTLSRHQKGSINELTLVGLPSMPPWHQTAPPSYASPSRPHLILSPRCTTPS